MAASPAYADRYRGWHHGKDDGDWGDVAQVLAGLLIIGVIAAAADNSQKKAKAPPPAHPPIEPPNAELATPAETAIDAPTPDPSPAISFGLDAAVEACVTEVQAAGHVADTIETVRRQDESWLVEGKLEGGKAFSCAVDATGTVSKLEVA